MWDQPNILPLDIKDNKKSKMELASVIYFTV
jgi:hypothetical protein